MYRNVVDDHTSALIKNTSDLSGVGRKCHRVLDSRRGGARAGKRAGFVAFEPGQSFHLRAWTSCRRDALRVTPQMNHIFLKPNSNATSSDAVAGGCLSSPRLLNT